MVRPPGSNENSAGQQEGGAYRTESQSGKERTVLNFSTVRSTVRTTSGRTSQNDFLQDSLEESDIQVRPDVVYTEERTVLNFSTVRPHVGAYFTKAKYARTQIGERTVLNHNTVRSPTFRGSKKGGGGRGG